MGKTLRDEDLRLNIIINGDNGRKEILELERTIHDTNAKLEACYEKRKKLEEQGKKDTASYRSLQLQIGKYSKELTANRERLAALQRQQSVNTMTLSELRAHINRVQIQLNKTDPKTPQWKQLNAELKLSKQRLAELSAQSKATGGAICTMAERANRYIGLITAGFASMTIARNYIYRTLSAYNDYDEALNNMRKTTGLTAEDAEELNRKLASIDTRTSQNELMSMVRVAGKLGISKDDLFGFAKAADVLKISLGKDLGDDVETTLAQIGKLTTVFHLTDEMNIEQAMMKTGAAINELGKRSTANEGNIVNFTKRVAGMGATSNISIADIMGLGAAVDASGIQIETAGTAINNVITGMFQRTREFAAVAKMPYKEFAELLKTDVNEALIRVLEGMSNTDGMEQVVASLDSLHIKGARSATVLSTLAGNTELLRQQQVIANQAFDEGTSCLNEFNIMNETATAKMEKHKKAVVEQAVALGRQLTPAINMSLSASTWFIRILSQVIAVGVKYKALIIGISTAYAANLVLKKGIVAWSKLQAFWNSANAATLVTETTLLNGVRKSTLLLCLAKSLLTGNLKAATIAFKAFWASTGPIGWLSLAIGAAVTAFSRLKNKVKEVSAETKAWSDINKKVSEELDPQKAKIEALTSIIHNNNLSIDARRKAIEALQKIIPDYTASLSKEGTLINENTRAVKKYIETLEEQIRLKAIEDKLAEAISKQIELEGAKAEAETKVKVEKGNMEFWARQDMTRENSMNVLYAARKRGDAQSELNKINESIAENDNLIKSLKTRVTEIYAGLFTGDGGGEGGGGEDDGGVDYGSGDYGSGSDKWSLDKDAEYQRQRHELKKKYLAGEIETEKEYNKQLLELEINTLQRRLNNDIDGAEERAKIQDQLDDRLIQQRKQNNEWSLGSDEAYMAAQLELKKKYLEGEIETEAEYDEQARQLEIAAIQSRLDMNIEQGEERIKIEQQLADKLLQEKKRSAQRLAEIESILADAEADRIAQENRRYEAERKKYAGQSDILAAIEKQHQRKLAKINLDMANARLAQEKSHYELERKTLQNKHRMELALFQGNAQQRRAMRQRHYQELAAFDETQLKSMVARLQALVDTGEIDDIKIDFSLLSDEEITRLKQQLQEIISELQNAQDVGQSVERKPNSGIDNGITFLGLGKSQWEDLFSGNLDGWEDWATKMGDIVAGAGELVMQLWSTFDQRQTDIEKKQLKEYEKNNDKKRSDLEKRLKAGLITEAQYNAEIQAMESEADAYKAELELKQAKRQKAMNLVEAIINTAVSVTKTFAQFGWPAGVVPAAIQAALGAAQIAAIATTPITTGAEEGGFQDVTRKQDGRKFRARLNPDARGFINTPTLLVSENGQEYVIPNDGLQNPTLMPLVNTIETARRNGTLRNLNFESIYPAISTAGRATGGFTTTTHENSQSSGRTAFVDNERLIQLLERLDEHLEHPIPAYITMLGRNGLIEMMQKYESYKKKGTL